MCSFCTAFLREEGVKVGGFPLTAAPVFHPGHEGKTLIPAGFLAAKINKVKKKQPNLIEKQ